MNIVNIDICESEGFYKFFSKLICSEPLSPELLLFERRLETFHSKPSEKYIGIPRELHAKLTKSIAEPKIKLRKRLHPD